LQHGHNRNSNLAFNSTRMDWQSSHTQSYPKASRSDLQTANDTSYTQLQDAHWYSAEIGMQLDGSRINGNACCTYETVGVGQHQHQRGIPIATSQAHSL